MGGSPMKAFNRQVGAAKSMAGICELVGVPYTGSDWPERAHTTQFYRTGGIGAKAFEAIVDGAAATAEVAEVSVSCVDAVTKATSPTVGGGDEKRPLSAVVDSAEDKSAAAKRAKVEAVEDA